MEEIKYTLMPNETNTYVNTNDSKTYIINSDCDEVLVESNNENIRIEQSGKLFKVIGVTAGISEITVTLSKTITIENLNKPPVEKPEAPEEIVPPPPPPVEEPLPEIPEEADLTDDQLRAAGLNRRTYAFFYKKMYDMLTSENSIPIIQTRDKNMISDDPNYYIKQLVLNVPNETRTPLINKLHDSQDQTMLDVLEILTLNAMYAKNNLTQQYELKTREEATKDYLFKNPSDKYEAYINLAFQQPFDYIKDGYINYVKLDEILNNIPSLLTYIDIVKSIPELKELLKDTENSLILGRAKKAGYDQQTHENMTEYEKLFMIYFYVSMQIYTLELQLNQLSKLVPISDTGMEDAKLQIDQIKFNIQILKDKLCYDMKLEPNAIMSQAYITGYADIEKYLKAKKWKFDASVVGTMAAEVELTEEDYTKAGQELTVLAQMVHSHCPIFKSIPFEIFDKYVNNYDELTKMTKTVSSVPMIPAYIAGMKRNFGIPPYKNKLDILVEHGFKKVVEFKGSEHTSIELEAKSAKKFYDTRKLIGNIPLETIHLVTDSIDPIFRNLFRKKDVEVARDYIAIAISELYNGGWAANNTSNAERVETEVFRILEVSNA